MYNLITWFQVPIDVKLGFHLYCRSFSYSFIQKIDTTSQHFKHTHTTKITYGTIQIRLQQIFEKRFAIYATQKTKYARLWRFFNDLWQNVCVMDHRNSCSVYTTKILQGGPLGTEARLVSAIHCHGWSFTEEEEASAQNMVLKKHHLTLI